MAEQMAQKKRPAWAGLLRYGMATGAMRHIRNAYILILLILLPLTDTPASRPVLFST